ncbi:MAG: hypothetical protein J6127_01400 [Clostridiales bacterium]|nr:hypothetical protein [Clostridiales bacterium]
MIINNIASYHRNVVNGGKTIVGFPSYDGRGPIIVGNESIGVSAHSSNVDGCMDFLRTVMSADCQRSFASANGFEGGIPVNRQAFAQVSDEYITSFNSRYNNSGATGSTEAMSMSSVFSGPADDSLKNGFESVVTGLTGNGYTVDAPINAIVREEIPAYFEGQKSLDEVINIINDRVQTVLNERG